MTINIEGATPVRFDDIRPGDDIECVHGDLRIRGTVDRCELVAGDLYTAEDCWIGCRDRGKFYRHKKVVQEPEGLGAVVQARATSGATFKFVRTAWDGGDNNWWYAREQGFFAWAELCDPVILHEGYTP